MRSGVRNENGTHGVLDRGTMAVEKVADRRSPRKETGSKPRLYRNGTKLETNFADTIKSVFLKEAKTENKQRQRRGPERKMARLM